MQDHSSSFNVQVHCWSSPVVIVPPAAPLSPFALLLHGASCTELGSTVNPAARTVATANTAAIKIVLFFIFSKRGYESIRIFELGRIWLLFRSRYI